MDVAERGPQTVEVPAASPLGSFVGNQLNGGVIAGGNVTQIIHNYVPQASAEDMSPLVEGIRDWLNVKVNFRAIHNDVRRKRVGSTGDWLINSPEYQEWKRSRGGVLCGTGIPGAGKTVLMSRVIDDLLPLEESTDRKVCVLFAYNRYSEPLSLCDILKGFVLQVVERHQHLAELVKPIKKRCTSERTEPTSDNLIDLLLKLEGHFDFVYYGLDGMDEVQFHTRIQLVKAINQLRGNFVIASRRLEELQSNLQRAVQFPLVARNEDMTLLIEEKLMWYQGLNGILEDAGCREKIIGDILEKANGMFLHAALQMEALRDCLCLADVQEELDNFPADITEMYTLTFRRIEAQGPRSARIAKTALLWLVHARDQFTLRDLQAALAVNPNTYSVELNRMPRKQSIISLCCGLVEHHPETDVVRLVHFTAKDALEPLLLKDHPQPHLLITKVLHQRLIDNNILDSTLDNGSELMEHLKGQPLLQYAYRRWPDHVRGCRDSVEVAAAFLHQCVSFAYIESEESWSFDILSPLHVAAAYDFPEFIQATLTDPCNESCPSVPGLQGADVNAQSRKGWFALSFASNKGHVACAEALLGCPDIDVNAPVPLTGQTALMEASRMAQEGMVERLLRVPGVAVNAQDKSGETALMQALLRNSTGIVRRLLQAPGIDVNLRNTVGRTALIIAAGYGHLDVFEQLLQAPGIDLTIRCDFKGFTALEQAIWVGWEGVTARIIKFATGWEVKFGRRRRGWKELFYALRSEPERFSPWFVTAMSKRLAMFEGGEEWWRVEIEEESGDESDTE